jgi:hypothetical protein
MAGDRLDCPLCIDRRSPAPVRPRSRPIGDAVIGQRYRTRQNVHPVWLLLLISMFDSRRDFSNCLMSGGS